MPLLLAPLAIITLFIWRSSFLFSCLHKFKSPLVFVNFSKLEENTLVIKCIVAKRKPLKSKNDLLRGFWFCLSAIILMTTSAVSLMFDSDTVYFGCLFSFIYIKTTTTTTLSSSDFLLYKNAMYLNLKWWMEKANNKAFIKKIAASLFRQHILHLVHSIASLYV